MIDFYTYSTINGQAVAIALQLLKLPHRKHVIDLTRGEQRSDDFLAINPSGRIPVIVDEIGDQPLLLSQTGAILIYLAEKNQQLLGDNTQQKYLTIQWMQFILTDISTNVFNNFHLKALVSPKQPQAGELLKQRAIDFCGEIDHQLSQYKYIAGERLSLADVAAFPVISQLKSAVLNERCSHINRWFTELADHPGFIKGMK